MLASIATDPGQNIGQTAQIAFTAPRASTRWTAHIITGPTTAPLAFDPGN